MCSPRSFLKCKCHLVFDCKNFACMNHQNAVFTGQHNRNNFSFIHTCCMEDVMFLELFSAHSLPRRAHLVTPLTSDLCPHLLSPVSLRPSLPPTQCNTNLLSHGTKTRGVFKNKPMRREKRAHLYLCAREGTERREKNWFPWKQKSCI